MFLMHTNLTAFGIKISLYLPLFCCTIFLSKQTDGDDDDDNADDDEYSYGANLKSFDNVAIVLTSRSVNSATDGRCYPQLGVFLDHV